MIAKFVIVDLAAFSYQMFAKSKQTLAKFVIVDLAAFSYQMFAKSKQTQFWRLYSDYSVAVIYKQKRCVAQEWQKMFHQGRSVTDKAEWKQLKGLAETWQTFNLIWK